MSRVINRSGFVSAGARAAIQQAIGELRYVPSASARGLASRHTGMVGLCLPVVEADADLADCRSSGQAPGAPGGEAATTVVDAEPVALVSWGGMYFGEVVRGAEFAAWNAGLAITVALVRSPDLEARVLNMAGLVDGMVIVSGTLPDDVWNVCDKILESLDQWFDRVHCVLSFSGYLSARVIWARRIRVAHDGWSAQVARRRRGSFDCGGDQSGCASVARVVANAVPTICTTRVLRMMSEVALAPQSPRSNFFPRL